jgi:hypothetical protein
MIQIDRNTCPGPPLLEQLGALCSLLAHDLANQLCVISGSTSFAQMVSNDPRRLNTALDAIARASEAAGHAVSSFGEYRRTLPGAFPPVPAGEVLAALSAYARQAGWKCIMPPSVEGCVLLPPQWAVFAASNIRTEIGPKPIVLRVNQYSPSNDGAGDFGAAVAVHDARHRTGLRIQFDYPSKKPFSIKDVRTRYENLGLLAAFELNRMLGGELDSHTPSCGHQSIDLWLPFEG